MLKARQEQSGFEDGIRAALQGILADPNFVYRFERPPSGVKSGSSYRVSDLELASRLSYFLWSSGPDETLIDLASRGKLKDPAVLEQQVRRMLADDRSEALAESFFTLPISATPMSLSAPLEMVRWGSRVFSAGLQIAMPIVAAMLITNIALAILTRAAPQLSLFGIGVPITRGAGFLIISLTLPYLGTPLQNLFNQGIEAGRKIPRVGGQRPGQPSPPAAPR